MIVESNYKIVIATLSDWLKRLAPVFQPMRIKTNRTTYAWFFPRFRASYRWLLRIVIGSSRCLLLLWLVGVIALVLVFQQSFENCSIGLRVWELYLVIKPGLQYVCDFNMIVLLSDRFCCSWLLCPFLILSHLLRDGNIHDVRPYLKYFLVEKPYYMS